MGEVVLTEVVGVVAAVYKVGTSGVIVIGDVAPGQVVVEVFCVHLEMLFNGGCAWCGCC